MKTITPVAGDHISDTCRAAVAMARREGESVSFLFNDIPIIATKDSNAEQLEREYLDKIDHQRREYRASDEYRKRREADERKDRERRAALSEALKGAPAKMTIRDESAWNSWYDNNTDGYGNAIIAYADRWARVMEARIAAGESLEDVARDSSHLADTEGITGFMYGAAVAVLSTSWIHGEQLRRWHNRDCQLTDEGDRANESGGVLNPALLSVGGK